MSNVDNRYIEEELKESYLDYSMSVIVSRALPDVRDGLNLFIEEFYLLWMKWEWLMTSHLRNLPE